MIRRKEVWRTRELAIHVKNVVRCFWTHISLGRYPKKSDFTPEQVGWIKSYLGPWPRALEACGILPDRSAERAEAKKHKRIASKRKMTQYKLAKQNGKTE